MTLIELHAGPLNMAFDNENAFLRYVRLGNQELVRGVFVAVRDHNWDTIPFSIDELKVQQTANSFSIDFVANSLQPEVSFVWNGTILGSSHGSVEYRFRGFAVAPFYRNRIGLCVLHASSCAGKPCRVDHVDGSVTLGTFPKLISPHQPFKNIRSISQHVEPNLQLKVEMAGDTFEMEDQRNWTDASFKTYSTPLDVPYPVRVEKGQEIGQSVKIELEGAPEHKSDATSSASNSLATSLLGPVCRVDIDWKNPVLRPKIGFQLPVEPPSPSQAILGSLQSIKPDHVRIDLWLEKNNWRADFIRGVAISQAIGSQLEIAIFTDKACGQHWSMCLELLQASQSRIARVLLFHTCSKSTPSEMIVPAYQAIKDVCPHVQVVVGTNAYFAELNRERPIHIPDRQVCYSINPQVHAFDNLSLCETLSAQRSTVDTAVELFDCDVVVSPITLRPRFNPNATSSIDLETQLLAAIDPRQVKGFGAAWTVGVLCNLLTHPRVSSATLYEAFGRRGVVGLDGQFYPVCETIAHAIRCKYLFYGACTSPLSVLALGTSFGGGETHILCGNLSPVEQRVLYRTPAGTERELVLPSESVEVVLVKEAFDA